MKLKLTIFAVLALLLLLTLAVAQTRYEQKLFSASFPAGDVEFSTQDTTSKDGLKIAVNEWNVYNGGAIYAIAYTDFAPRKIESCAGPLRGARERSVIFSTGIAGIDIDAGTGIGDARFIFHIDPVPNSRARGVRFSLFHPTKRAQGS